MLWIDTYDSLLQSNFRVVGQGSTLMQRRCVALCAAIVPCLLEILFWGSLTAAYFQLRFSCFDFLPSSTVPCVNCSPGNGNVSMSDDL